MNEYVQDYLGIKRQNENKEDISIAYRNISQPQIETINQSINPRKQKILQHRRPRKLRIQQYTIQKVL